VVNRDSRYEVGDLVMLSEQRGGRHGGRVRVVRRLGRPDVARDVISALMIDRGLSPGFDPAVARAARQASESTVGVDGRRDLRELATFTIDPTSARDFDDAISAAALGAGEGDGWRVWVHIADVAQFVPGRSLVDREAYRRGTSVYVPGAVEPMLPRELSNGACSLVPGEARATVTVEMVVGEGGVRSASMYRSLICSDERLDYERVDRIFSGVEGVAEPWGAPLAVARAAAAALGALRAGRAGLVLDSPEPEFRFDRAGHVVGVELSAQTESHRLIEALMVAANEQVARFLADRDVPALYRVHERPEPGAVERLLGQLASLGVPTPPAVGGDRVMTPQQAGELVGEASALVASWVVRHDGQGARALNSLILRALKQAQYDDRNLGHAGLASSGYCHFTSPIRRYPDLICHRALLSAIAGEPVPDRAGGHAPGPWTSGR
jgi:ribonuclease R